MKWIYSVMMIVFGVTAVLGQKQMSDLDQKHAAALETFLSRNGDYRFLSESVIEAHYLKDMRNDFKGLKPYYRVGDLNRDGIRDFAIILSRKGARKDNGEGVAETHRYDYPLAVVIFNGTKNGTYNKALVEDIDAPYACFLNPSTVKGKKQLYFAVFESDADTRIFSPVGKAYKIESR